MNVWLERNIASDFLDQSFLQEFEEMMNTGGINEVDAKLMEDLEPMLTKCMDVELESPQKMQPHQVSRRIQLSLPESLCTADKNRSATVNGVQQSLSMLVNIKQKEQNAKILLNDDDITEGIQQRSSSVLPKPTQSNVLHQPSQKVPNAETSKSEQENLSLPEDKAKQQLEAFSIKTEKNMALSALFSKSVCTTLLQPAAKCKGGRHAVSKVKKETKIKAPKSTYVRKKSNSSINKEVLSTKSVTVTKKIKLIKSNLLETHVKCVPVKAVESASSYVSPTVEIGSINNSCAKKSCELKRNKVQVVTCNNVELPSINIYSKSVPCYSDKRIVDQNSLAVTSNVDTCKVVQPGKTKIIYPNRNLNSLVHHRISAKQLPNSSVNKNTTIISNPVNNIQNNNSTISKNVSMNSSMIRNAEIFNQPVQITSSIMSKNTTVVGNSVNIIQNTNTVVNGNKSVITSEVKNVQIVSQLVNVNNLSVTKNTTVISNSIKDIQSVQQFVQNTVPETNQVTMPTSNEPPRKKPRIFAKNSKETKNKFIQEYIKKELQNGITGNEVKVTTKPALNRTSSKSNSGTNFKKPVCTPPCIKREICKKCNIVFINESVFQKHMEYVHGVKPTKIKDPISSVPNPANPTKKNNKVTPLVLENINSKNQLCTSLVRRGCKRLVKRELYNVDNIVVNHVSSVKVDNITSTINGERNTSPIAVEDSLKNEISDIKNETNCVKKEKCKPTILNKIVQIKKESNDKELEIKKEEGVESENIIAANNKLKSIPVPLFTQKHSIAFIANGRKMNKCKYCMESYADIFILNRHLSSNHKIHENKAAVNYGNILNLFNV